MTTTSPPRFLILILGLGLAFVFASTDVGVAQSLFSVRPDSSGSLLDEDTPSEDRTFGDIEADPDAADEGLEMRMRYPELYDSDLTTELERSAAPEDTEAGVDETLETQARYPEIYLENRLYDENDLLSIDREE